MRKDILENANTYTLSDFQKLKLAESYKKLYSDTVLENAKRKKDQYDKRIYNLSIKNLFENFFTVWTQIINEMTGLMYDNDNNKSWNNYISILMKNDRIIYVGIMFVLIGLIMYFIFLTK
jgi:hypothetical protein